MKLNRSMNKQSGVALTGLVVAMAVVYIFVLIISVNGWGYMGYNGYHRGPSFMYWGGPDIHHEKSVRDGSVGGPNSRGGGFSGGK